MEYMEAYRATTRKNEAPANSQQRQGKYKYIEQLNLQDELEHRDRKEEQKPITSYKIDGQRNVVSFGRENHVVDNVDELPEGSER
mgnify:CR=1 FL=1|jgi:hypothetical protein